MDITLAWFEFLSSLGALCKPLPSLLIGFVAMAATGAYLLRVPKQKRKATSSTRIVA